MTETKELLRKRFAELNAEREAILARSGPLRAQRDKIVNDAREQELVLNRQIKEIEKDMYQIDTDRAMLARALGGRAMSDSRG